MATTRTSKKSPAKKTSKTASAAARTSANKKTVKKSTTKKTVRKVTTKAASVSVKTSSPRDAWKTLRAFHVLNVVASAALGALTILLTKVSEKSVFASYVTSDDLVAGKTVAGLKEFYTLDLRWIVVALLTVNGLFSLLAATRGWSMYSARVKDGKAVGRWIISGLSAALALEVVLLLIGVSDLLTIKLLVALPLILAATCLLAERLKGVKEKWFAFAASCVIALLLTGSVVTFIAHSIIYGRLDIDWSVYAASGVFLGGLVLHGLNQALQLKGKKNFTDSLSVERNYLLITMLMQVALAAVVVISLRK